jgi:adenosylcobinamide-phosphate synthase
VAEAAFAGALGVRLGGTNRYGSHVEVRPSLGDGRAPDRSDIGPALRLGRDVSRMLAGLVLAVGAAAR